MHSRVRDPSLDYGSDSTARPVQWQPICQQRRRQTMVTSVSVEVSMVLLLNWNP